MLENKMFLELPSKSLFVKAGHHNWEPIRALCADPDEQARWSYSRRLARDIAHLTLAKERHHHIDLQNLEWRLRHLHKRVCQVKL